MSTISTPKRSGFLLNHLPVYDFLAPSFVQSSRARRHFRQLSTRQRCSAEANSNNSQTQPSDLSSRSQGSRENAALDPASPTKSLTQTQRDFLTSAVRPSNLLNLSLYSHVILVTSKSGWRISSHLDIHCPNPPHRKLTPSLTTSYETYVQSRGRTFQDLQLTTSETPRTTYGHVPHMDICCISTRMGDGCHGA